MAGCPSCSTKRGIRKIDGRASECPRCGCIFGEMYLGDSYNYVLPYWETQAIPAEKTRPYDFTCLGSQGITRRRGWFNPETKRITQTG
jgi:hypothetical protein